MLRLIKEQVNEILFRYILVCSDEVNKHLLFVEYHGKEIIA